MLLGPPVGDANACAACQRVIHKKKMCRAEALQTLLSFENASRGGGLREEDTGQAYNNGLFQDETPADSTFEFHGRGVKAETQDADEETDAGKILSGFIHEAMTGRQLMPAQPQFCGYHKSEARSPEMLQ